MRRRNRGALVWVARLGVCARARAAAIEIARERGVRVDAYTIGGAGLQDRGGFAAAYGLAADGAVLVRPDGYVAWRSRSGPASVPTLRDVLRTVLAR